MLQDAASLPWAAGVPSDGNWLWPAWCFWPS